MSDILFTIYDPKWEHLTAADDPQRKVIWDKLVEIWRDRGLFKPEKAVCDNLIVDFVYRPNALQKGLSMKITAESTQGSGLFQPDTSDNPAFWIRFEKEAGDDIAALFSGDNIGFWPTFKLGKYGEHRKG